MQLRRLDDGKVIAGVASGIAASTNIDPTWIRVGLVLFTFFGGSGVLLYLVLWAVIPRETGGTVAEDGLRQARQWYDEQHRGGSGPQH